MKHSNENLEIEAYWSKNVCALMKNENEREFKHIQHSNIK